MSVLDLSRNSSLRHDRPTLISFLLQFFSSSKNSSRPFSREVVERKRRELGLQLYMKMLKWKEK